jgi:hypothetical protein
MGIKVAVFGGGHLDVCVLVPSADIMTDEHLGCWYGAASVGYPDFGTDGEILHLP